MSNVRAASRSAPIVLGFFLVLFPLGARAQEAVPKDTAAIDSSGAHKLEAMRVNARREKSRYGSGYTRSGTKTPALPRDIPQSMVTITSRLLKDQAMQGLGDVTRFIPGATMGQGEGNRDQITIRGNNSTADFFVDGVRDDTQYFRDLYNLERVEALKGSNAMLFGRGGGGGVINRVTKEAQWDTRHEVTAEGGSFGGRRISTDLQRSLSSSLAMRLNSVYEDSDLYRDGAILERTGVNPAFSFANPSRSTLVSIGYEHFQDRRTADRGIPSFQGTPVDTDPSTFFGKPEESLSNVKVNNAQATISHDAGRVQLRNHTRFADYGKFYQNIFPGAVSTDGSMVSISGYNNETNRRNLFNQTDVNWTAQTGEIQHRLLVGVEIGRQSTDNFRETGYFGDASSVMVPVSNPRVQSAVSFRQNASDASNESEVTTTSLYLQDELSLSPKVRLIAGARFEKFAADFDDIRSGTSRSRTDEMISPRVGIVAKPSELVSVYASYGVSYLPGSGDQFSSLSEITAALEPEQFTNYEAGVKWDVRDRLALTAALYRLDRTNTRAIDPANPRLLLQTGEQRSQGFEMGAIGSLTSKWEVAAGLARQNARIISATAAAPAGAIVPLVPRTSASVWSRYNFTQRVGAAFGALHQSSTFAGIDNKVTLPAFERYDAALYAGIGWGLRAQLNVENLFDTRYYPTAHSNNNITPGSPRAARLSMTAEF
jgi:catecholate siderophore receptor